MKLDQRFAAIIGPTPRDRELRRPLHQLQRISDEALAGLERRDRQGFTPEERAILDKARREADLHVLSKVRDRQKTLDVLDATREALKRWYSSCAEDASLEHLARMVAKVACSELGIEMPTEILFFSEESPAEAAYVRERGHREWEAFSRDFVVDGAADISDRRIWIKARMDPRRVIETVAHEVRHLAPGGLDEEVATRYGVAFLAQWPTLN